MPPKKSLTPIVKATKLPPVTPIEIDNVRRRALAIVKDRMQDANDVLKGEKKWDAQQTRLFLGMLNKIVPDLNYTKKEVHITDKSLSELTEAELLQIATTGHRLDATIERDDIEDAEVIDITSD